MRKRDSAGSPCRCRGWPQRWRWGRIVGQQRAAEAQRAHARLQQLQQRRPRIQRAAGACDHLLRGDVLAQEQQQVFALLLGQDIAEIVGHRQVIGGDHDDGVLAVAAIANARDQLADQPVATLERMQQPDVTQRAVVVLALARQRQMAGRVVGVHGQRGEHERLAGARQRLEAVPGIVQ